MNVNKKDIMIFFDERIKELNEKIENEKEIHLQNMAKTRLLECLYTKEMISLIWNIIHQKKGK